MSLPPPPPPLASHTPAPRASAPPKALGDREIEWKHFACPIEGCASTTGGICDKAWCHKHVKVVEMVEISP